jgi:hypothetical protein
MEEINEYQINEVRKRTKAYLENPQSALDFDAAIEEIEKSLEN